MYKILFFIAFIVLSCTPQKKLQNTHHTTMPTINTLHDETKDVSAKLLFKGSENTTTALQIKKDGLLQEHITKVEALLVCVSGEVVFENEKGIKQTLKTGNYIKIEAMVKHWVKGLQDSQLLLIK